MRHHNADLDPLIVGSSNGGGGSKSSKGIAINKREYRLSQTEKCGRLRLGVFSICIFFVIYFCFAIGTWSDRRLQIIVNVPPSDDTLPGPKGIKDILL